MTKEGLAGAGMGLEEDTIQIGKIQFRTPKIRVAKERAAINDYEYPPDDLKISR